MNYAAPALLGLCLMLVACSSTSPPTARASLSAGPPTATAEAARAAGSAQPDATSSASPTRQGATPTPLGEGPQSASMAALQIGGERFATLGDPQAAVTMVEFSDYGCPYCRLYSASGFPEIKRRFIDSGQIYYVFKDFPVVELHPQARLAAQAAECSGEQGRYWDYHNQLFANPGEWQSSPQTAVDVFERYAVALGMDAGALRACIEDGRFAQEVGQDYAEARALGLTGTPTFIINGKLLSGARAPAQFVELLEREVERVGE